MRFLRLLHPWVVCRLLFEMEGVLSMSRRDVAPAERPLLEHELSQFKNGDYDKEPETTNAL